MLLIYTLRYLLLVIAVHIISQVAFTNVVARRGGFEAGSAPYCPRGIAVKEDATSSLLASGFVINVGTITPAFSHPSAHETGGVDSAERGLLAAYDFIASK